jgi:hypothetical protein
MSSRNYVRNSLPSEQIPAEDFIATITQHIPDISRW